MAQSTRRWTAAAAAAILSSLAPVGARAASPTQPLSPITIARQPDAPVQITSAWYQLVSRGDDRSPNLLVCYTFDNVGARMAVAVQMQAAVFDAFDTVVAYFQGQRTGTFTPHVIIEGPSDMSEYVPVAGDRKAPNCFYTLDVWPQLQGVGIGVMAVRFDDGTIWRAKVGPQKGATP